MSNSEDKREEMEEEKSVTQIGISISEDEEEHMEDENSSWDLKEINRAKYERSRLMKLKHKKELKQTKARCGKFEKCYPDSNFQKNDEAWNEWCEDRMHLMRNFFKRTACMKTWKASPCAYYDDPQLCEPHPPLIGN